MAQEAQQTGRCSQREPLDPKTRARTDNGRLDGYLADGYLAGTISSDGLELAGTLGWHKHKHGYFHFRLRDEDVSRFTGGVWESEGDYKAGKPALTLWSGEEAP